MNKKEKKLVIHELEQILEKNEGLRGGDAAEAMWESIEERIQQLEEDK